MTHIVTPTGTIPAVVIWSGEHSTAARFMVDGLWKQASFLPCGRAMGQHAETAMRLVVDGDVGEGLDG